MMRRPLPGAKSSHCNRAFGNSVVDGFDVGVDEGVVALSAYPGVPVPDVGGIVEQTRPVGADIEHDGNHTGRVNAAGRGINRQFADRHFNAAHSPVADSQNLLGIGGEDQVDIAGAGAEVGKGLFDRFGMIDGEVDAARTAALVVVLLHGHADGQIVDDGDHFAQVLGKQPVEQHLVAVVQGGQVDVLAQRIRQPLVLDVGAFDLRPQRADVRRQQAREAQRFSLFRSEGCPLVQQRRVEYGEAASLGLVAAVAVLAVLGHGRQ